MIDTPKITIMFNWESLQPDYRQYKPANPLILTNLKIGIEIPLDSKYILNATKIASAQLTNQKEDEPILTPQGMRYCIDQFEAVMGNNGTSPKTETATNDDDWADVEEENPEETAKSSDDAPWDDNEETKETKTDENFDEDWG